MTAKKLLQESPLSRIDARHRGRDDDTGLGEAFECSSRTLQLTHHTRDKSSSVFTLKKKYSVRHFRRTHTMQIRKV